MFPDARDSKLLVQEHEMDPQREYVRLHSLIKTCHYHLTSMDCSTNRLSMCCTSPANLITSSNDCLKRLNMTAAVFCITDFHLILTSIRPQAIQLR